MFSSAESRMPPSMISLNTKKEPEGSVQSPHMISLWDNKKTPPKSFKKPLEGLFVKPLMNEPGEKTLHFFTESESQNDDQELWRQMVAPSVPDQISRVKNAKKEYSDLFEGSYKGNAGGLFRRFW